MSAPSDRAVRNLFAQLRALTERHPKTGRVPLDDFEARLLDALARDRVGSVMPDGYAVTTLGSDVGTSRRSASSTERAAIALADPETKLPRDRHHELTSEALGKLTTAVLGVQGLEHRLEALRALGTDEGPRTLTCEACTGLRGKGADRPVEHRGTVGDRLTRRLDLCAACYKFVERSAKPNTREGQLPTPEQVARHEERGYWYLRTTRRGTPHLTVVDGG